MEIEYNSIGFLLNRASWAMADNLKDSFEKNNIDLTLAQYTILRVLYEKEGCCQLDIARILLKDVSSIKRNLDILEKKKLIERKPASLCKYHVYATKEGRRLQPIIMDIANRTMEKVLKDIPAETVELAIDFLKKIYASRNGEASSHNQPLKK